MNNDIYYNIELDKIDSKINSKEQYFISGYERIVKKIREYKNLKSFEKPLRYEDAKTLLLDYYLDDIQRVIHDISKYTEHTATNYDQLYFPIRRFLINRNADKKQPDFYLKVHSRFTDNVRFYRNEYAKIKSKKNRTTFELMYAKTIKKLNTDGLIYFLSTNTRLKVSDFEDLTFKNELDAFSELQKIDQSEILLNLSDKRIRMNFPNSPTKLRAMMLGIPPS